MDNNEPQAARSEGSEAKKQRDPAAIPQAAEPARSGETPVRPAGAAGAETGSGVDAVPAHMHRQPAAKQTQDETADERADVALRHHLDALDEMFPFPTPEPGWFRQQAAEAGRRRKQRLYRELVLLWGAALLIWAVLYVAITRKPAAFLWLQAAAVLAPLIELGMNKREVRRDDNT